MPAARWPLLVLAAAAASAAPASAEGGAAGAAAPPTFPPAPPGSWQWVPLPGTKCMDGSETGVWLKYGPAGAAGTQLGVYLSGGGACFNLETCLTASHTAKPGAPGSGGIFNGTRPDNPFRNSSWIVVPYCTGDVHIGDRTALFNLELRHFHGAPNLRAIMTRAVATFRQTEVFVATGESAGGFGAISAYNLMRSYWHPGVRGVMLDDSGPVIDDVALAPCLQALWRRTWDLNGTLPPRCPCISAGGGLSAIWNFTKSRWPSDTFGLISSLKDSTISTFFAYGELDCHDPLIPVGYDKLAGGLKRLSRDVPVYMISGSEHTHTGGKAEFYTKTSGGVSLLSWVTALVQGKTPPSVSPAAER